MALWHRNRGPRDPEQTRDVNRTINHLDYLLAQLTQRTEYLEAIHPPDPEQRREGDR